jgi:cysteinyl-tRNA synthetase
MALQLYNTLTRRKEVFTPIDPTNVRVYVCGPTVYDYAHIGNARPPIVFDVLFRLLRQIYGAEHVAYVRNITDVDDKINARAAERGISIRELTEETNAIFQADAKALGCLEPTVQPRATEHIAAMIAMVEKLIASGHAYPAAGHILFDVPSMPDYGKLSRRPLDEMIAGARVEVAPYKKNPMDFVLWKPSAPDEPGWESPWGRGRPGWHLECSAMSWEYLGEVFDIHGGGIDLVFPHHENEIAQSCSAFHRDVMANYWMHNGFLQVEGEKMSKSLGNFVTIRELLKTSKFGGRKWDGQVLRFAMLQTHYRQPIDWTARLLEQSDARLNNWKSFAADRTRSKLSTRLFDEMIEALTDDINTPAVFAIIDRVVASEKPTYRDRYTVYKILKTLGLKGGRSNVSILADNAMEVVKDISQVSVDGWKNIAICVLTRPELKNVEPSTASRLLAAMALLTETIKSIEPVVHQASRIDYVLKLKGEFAQKFVSVKSGFDVRNSGNDHSMSLITRDSVFLFPNVRSISDEVEHDEISQFVDDIVKVVKGAARISMNDWKKIAAGVRQKPELNSGRPKSGSRLLAVIALLQERINNLEPTIHQALKSSYVSYLKDEFARRFISAESDFEVAVNRLIELRNLARAAKNWAESDRIRDELLETGIDLKDNKDGTTSWEVKR